MNSRNSALWNGTTQALPGGGTAVRAARVGAAIPWTLVMDTLLPGNRVGRASWVADTILQAQGKLPGR